MYTQVIPLAAISGQPNCYVLRAPTRGTIKRFIIKQVGGDLDGFTYDIYDRMDACLTQSEQSFNPDDATLGDRVLHTIAPTRVLAAGEPTDRHYELDWAYENISERDPTNKRRTGAVFLELTPGGAGGKDFEVAYTIESFDPD